MADFKSIRDSVLSSLSTAAEKTKDFADKAVDVTKDLADKAVDKAKDVSRVAKLNMEMNTEKTIIDRAYLEIGKLYYETRKDNPDGFFIQLCDEITLAKENIATIQAEIDSIKAGDDSCSEGVEVEFTVVAEEEKSGECSCGCSEHEAPKAEEKAEGCSCGCADHEAPKE